MKFSAIAFSAIVGLAAAQLEMRSEVPQCALECFTSSITKTDCALTDFYCQCGKYGKQIQESTLECLCSSECTTSDLAKVYNISNKLCTKTLEEHGESYDMPPSLASGICSKGKGGAEEPSSNTTGTAQPTGSNSTSSASPSSTSGADFEGAASSNFGKSMAAVAVGGLAFLAM